MLCGLSQVRLQTLFSARHSSSSQRGPAVTTLLSQRMEACMRKAVFFSVVVCCFLGFISGTVLGQSAASASITGRVTDPQGAVVANATVTATNVATGVARSA